MEKEYKSKFERFKIEVNDMIKTHHPFGVFSKINSKKQEEVKESLSNLMNDSISSQNILDQTHKLDSIEGNCYTKKLIENKEFYIEFANKAFENVKYDMKLYNKMKNNYCQFCKDIMKILKRDHLHFDSKIFSSH